MSLPTELLSYIFMLYIANSTAHPLHDDDLPPYHWWQTLMLVCRRWHSIVLSTPGLWRNVAITTPRALDSVLGRSHNMSLSISGMVADLHQLGRLEALQVARRIRRLDLTISKPMIQSWTAPVPVLDSLKLKEMAHNGVVPQPINEQTLLTRFNINNLHTLNLDGFSWPSIRPVLRTNVEELTLSGTATRIRTGSFLQALSSTSRLRQLTLSCTLTHSNGAFTVVRLSELESIRMVIGSPRDVRFLRFVDAPALKHAQFELVTDDEQKVAEIMNIVQPLLRTVARNSQLRAARIYFPNPQDLYVTVTEEATMRIHPGCGIHLELGVESQETVLELVREELHDILGGVQILAICDGEGYRATTIKAWYALFDEMPNVRSLRLLGKGVAAIPKGFTYKADDKTWHSVFPELQSLTLDGVRFRPARGSQRRGFFYDLKRSFERRNTTELNNLTIRNGIKICQKDVDSLRVFVQNEHVVWDEVERKK